MGRRAAQGEVLETTLGELITALVEETEHFVDSEKETNRVVALILADLLCDSKTALQDRPVSVRAGCERRILVVH